MVDGGKERYMVKQAGSRVTMYENLNKVMFDCEGSNF